jgi:hypothetical protein
LLIYFGMLIVVIIALISQNKTNISKSDHPVKSDDNMALGTINKED